VGYWTNVDANLGARVAAGLRQGNGPTGGNGRSASTTGAPKAATR
jgi:hypothetical protein